MLAVPPASSLQFPSGHSGISGTAVSFGCLVFAVPPARILATASCLFIVPNNSGLLRFLLRSLPVTLVYPVRSSLLAVLLCGIPNNARGVFGCTLRFRPRDSPRLYTLHSTPYTVALLPFPASNL